MKPRRYETLLLLSPDLSEEEYGQIKEKLFGIVNTMGGRILKVEDWGRRRLAYPVEKQMSGLYTLVDYIGSPALLSEVERNIRIEERIFKYMTLVLDKDFTEEKYQAELEQQAAERARREAERAAREAERARWETESAEEEPGGFEDEESDDDDESSGRGGDRPRAPRPEGPRPSKPAEAPASGGASDRSSEDDK